MGIMDMRAMSDGLFGGGRGRLWNIASKLFNGRRDLYKSLGYKRVLEPADFRSRYRRNAVANRIVKALPKATWRGGAELIDDDANPDKMTEFEQAWFDLNERLNIWDKIYRADVLAGIGRYAIILIGAPGELDQPLLNCGPDEMAYLTPYAEEDATIQLYETDSKNPRFGLPTFYSVKRTTMNSPTAQNTANIAKQVHWTRVIHIADGLLDDQIFGEPRLECVWNLLDDLEKVTGAGAEAFWKRADGGMQFDLDPTLEFNTESKDALKKQLHEYEHDLRRMLLTRGVKVNNLGSAVSDFSSPVESIISQISAGTGIPQRILMGSERGQLASTQDRSNWDDRATDRRNEYAIPYVVRPIVKRFQELGVLPEAKDKKYEVRFSALRVMDDSQRAEVANKWATLNSAAGEVVVTADDIREKVLQLPPLEDEQRAQPVPEPENDAERAMVRVMEHAIKTNNAGLLESLVGITPSVRTIAREATPSAELSTLVSRVEALQAEPRAQTDPVLRDLMNSLSGSIRLLANQPAPIVNVSPVVQIPTTPPRKFALKVNRDEKGRLAASTIEEIE